LRPSPAKERPVRDYTPEYESFRDDAVAVINGLAVVIALAGTWTRPIYMGIIGLLVALFGYFLNPRSKGGHILAVILITVFAVLETWWWQGKHIF
jgi:lipopolysaccharide export LptBFGC system permease protein LptF